MCTACGMYCMYSVGSCVLGRNPIGRSIINLPFRFFRNFPSSTYVLIFYYEEDKRKEKDVTSDVNFNVSEGLSK